MTCGTGGWQVGAKLTEHDKRTQTHAIFATPPDVYRGEILGGVHDGDPVVFLCNDTPVPKCPEFEVTMTLHAAQDLVEYLVQAITEIYDLNPQLAADVEEDEQSGQ